MSVCVCWCCEKIIWFSLGKFWCNFNFITSVGFWCLYLVFVSVPHGQGPSLPSSLLWSVSPWLNGSSLCKDFLAPWELHARGSRCVAFQLCVFWMRYCANPPCAFCASPHTKNAPFYSKWNDITVLNNKNGVSSLWLNQSFTTSFCLGAVCSLSCLLYSAEEPGGKKR